MCAQAELAEAEAEAAAPEDSDEEEFVYNPLKLPLGWDGKPIPYWLYKLHGLNQEFKCEICGNQSYWGRCVARLGAQPCVPAARCRQRQPP
jgi:splicing factor 3A subunit 3